MMQGRRDQRGETQLSKLLILQQRGRPGSRKIQGGRAPSIQPSHSFSGGLLGRNANSSAHAKTSGQPTMFLAIQRHCKATIVC